MLGNAHLRMNRVLDKTDNRTPSKQSFYNRVRDLIILAAIITALPFNVSACMGPLSETTILMQPSWINQPEGQAAVKRSDAVAVVEVVSHRVWGAIVRVKSVLRGSLKAGGLIAVRYERTDCNSGDQVGAIGTVLLMQSRQMANAWEAQEENREDIAEAALRSADTERRDFAKECHAATIELEAEASPWGKAVGKRDASPLNCATAAPRPVESPGDTIFFSMTEAPQEFRLARANADAVTSIYITTIRPWGAIAEVWGNSQDPTGIIGTKPIIMCFQRTQCDGDRVGSIGTVMLRRSAQWENIWVPAMRTIQ